MIEDTLDTTFNQFASLAEQYERQREKPLQSLSASPQFGFEPIPEPPKEIRLCPSFDHAAPKYMSIPIGFRYRHVCPLCGTITYVNSNIMLC